MLRILELGYRNDFTQAASVAESLIRVDRNSPTGWLYLSVVLQGRMMDEEEDSLSDRILALLDSAETRCPMSVGNATATRHCLYRGHIEGYRAILALRSKSYLKAYSAAKSSVEWYQAGLDRDVSLYDAYLGLGGYYFWRSSALGFLGWLLGDDRPLGTRSVRLTAEKGLYARDAAYNALGWIYVEQNQPDSALAIARMELERYPTCRVFQWLEAAALAKAERWSDASRSYEVLAEAYAAIPSNGYNRVECLYQASLAATKGGERLAAGKYRSAALTVPLTPKTRERLADRLKAMQNSE